MLKRYQWLSWITAFLSALLMIWTQWVSFRGSNLACPDWPFCSGTLQETTPLDLFLEWGHRFLAFSNAALILILIYFLFSILKKSERTPRALLKGTTVALVLQVVSGVLIQFWGLGPIHAVVHGVLQFSVVFLLFALGFALSEDSLTWRWIKPQLSEDLEKVRKGIWIALGVYGAFSLWGALLRSLHWGTSCAHFPGCTRFAFFPTSEGMNGVAEWLTFLHRNLGLFLVPLVGFLGRWVYRNQNLKDPLRPALLFWASLFVAHLVIGVVSVWTEFHWAPRVLHVATSLALGWTLLWFNVRMGRLRFLWER